MEGSKFIVTEILKYERYFLYNIIIDVHYLIDNPDHVSVLMHSQLSKLAVSSCIRYYISFHYIFQRRNNKFLLSLLFASYSLLTNWQYHLKFRCLCLWNVFLHWNYNNMLWLIGPRQIQTTNYCTFGNNLAKMLQQNNN